LKTNVNTWLGNGVAYIKNVTLCQAGLALRWVKVHVCTILIFNHQSMPTQPGHPSLCSCTGVVTVKYS